MINLKLKTTTLIVLIALIVKGCIVPSLQPIYNKTDLLFKSGLIGEWAGSKSIWTFEKGEEKSYSLTYKECDDPINNPSKYSSCTMAEFEVHLIKLNNEYYIDFLPVNYRNTENLFLLFHIRALHSFAKISWDEDMLQIIFLDNRWLKKILKEKPNLISHIITDGDVILTASPDELQQFLKDNSANKDAYIEPLGLQRIDKAK